ATPLVMRDVFEPPHWPSAFGRLVTWCLKWDPSNRPTSRQAMDHEFFTDATDPLKPS
ncbi:Serine/threonine protein kinase, partial [Exophiala xenobiotica]